MSGMKKRLRGMEMENARLRAMLRKAREDIVHERRRHQEIMQRFGAPYIAHVVSSHGDYWQAHTVVRTTPTPRGLQVEIAA